MGCQKRKKPKDAKALATSIQQLEEIGGTENVLMGAKKKLVNALKHAEQTLISVTKKGCIEILTAAIAQAEQIGVANRALAKAWQRLQVLLEEGPKKTAKDA